MVTSIRVNYGRFVNIGLVPGTDYENSVLEDILEWADENLTKDCEISLPQLIDLYWAIQNGEVEYIELDDDGNEKTA